MAEIERPYPGLRSFAKDESRIFFGRDDQTAAMIDRMSRSHFLCITGPSGCGKSSLGRTGLMNGLEAGFLAGTGSDWVFVDHRPEDQPMHNLCRALAAAINDHHDDAFGVEDEELAASLEETLRASPRRLPEIIEQLGGFGDRQVLLFVDQFEELFRFAQRDRNEASAFIETLITTAERRENIRVAITTRIESLEHSSYFDGLSQAIARGLFLTPSMDRFQLQQAIEGPAELFEGRIDTDFSLWLLNQMDGRADQLPLMQHILRVLWEEQAQTGEHPIVLTRKDFDDQFHHGAPEADSHRDALEEALSSHMDDVFDALSEEDQVLTRRMFCALADPLSNRRDNRRPQRVEQLAEIADCSVEDVIRIMDPFRADGRDFLLPPFQDALASDTQIDIRHEAILRRWVRLSGEWLHEESENGRRMQDYARIARDFANGDDDLLMGSRLDTAEEWKRRAEPNAGWGRRFLLGIEWLMQDAEQGVARWMSPVEIFQKTMDYLTQSSEAEEERRQRRIEERDRLRRQKKMRQRTVGAVLVLLLSVTPIAILGYSTYQGYLGEQIRAEETARAEARLANTKKDLMAGGLSPEFADAAAEHVIAAEQQLTTSIDQWKTRHADRIAAENRDAPEGEPQIPWKYRNWRGKSEKPSISEMVDEMMVGAGGCAAVEQWARPSFASDGYAVCRPPAAPRPEAEAKGYGSASYDTQVVETPGLQPVQGGKTTPTDDDAPSLVIADGPVGPVSQSLFASYRGLIDNDVKGGLAYPKFAAAAAMDFEEGALSPILSRYTAWAYATMEGVEKGFRRSAAWQCLEAARQQACRLADYGFRYNDIKNHMDSFLSIPLIVDAYGTPDGNENFPRGDLGRYIAALNGANAQKLDSRFDALLAGGAVDDRPGVVPQGDASILRDADDRKIYLRRNIARSYSRAAQIITILDKTQCSYGARTNTDCAMAADFYERSAQHWIKLWSSIQSDHKTNGDDIPEDLEKTHAYSLLLMADAWLNDPLLREQFADEGMSDADMLSAAEGAYEIRKSLHGSEVTLARYLTRTARLQCVMDRPEAAQATLGRVIDLSRAVAEELRTREAYAKCFGD
ncbi:MAG: ATP-binding protein [Pseudomonadota bacterium]